MLWTYWNTNGSLARSNSCWEYSTIKKVRKTITTVCESWKSKLQKTSSTKIFIKINLFFKIENLILKIWLTKRFFVT
jgi:hypothetical protein